MEDTPDDGHPPSNWGSMLALLHGESMTMRKVRPRTRGEVFVSDLKTRYVWKKTDDNKSSPKIIIPTVHHGEEDITLHCCKGDRRTTVD